MVEVNSCLYKLLVRLMRLLDCNKVYIDVVFLNIDIQRLQDASILRFASNAGLLSYLCS